MIRLPLDICESDIAHPPTFPDEADTAPSGVTLNSAFANVALPN